MEIAPNIIDLVRWFLTLLGVLAACSYNPRTNNIDPGGDGGSIDTFVPLDTTPAPMIDPLHVPPEGGTTGTSDIVAMVSIDTTALTVDGVAVPNGVVFDTFPQSGGPEVAVLHVRKLAVPSGATVRVTGDRALVVVASGEILIDGVLDGGGRRDVPGPAGAGPGMGPGAGQSGTHVNFFRDSGGSGGGFATDGGTGGRTGGCTPAAQTRPGGLTYAEPSLLVLVAGSGGGATSGSGSACGSTTAGAGGGAIQLSSATRVTIVGSINVGGGGGGGGRAQVSGGQCDITSGAGGGSGGAVVLQAPNVSVTGTLVSHGGGGGSSGADPDGDDAPPEADGLDGGDGSTTGGGIGGADVGVWGSAGGDGATTTSAGDGLANNDCDGNGGGGGGASGRIVVAIPADGMATLTGTTSPTAAQITY